MSDPNRSDIPHAMHQGRPVEQARNLLPPVEPPATRFLMQLFVTPLIIVAVIVLTFFGITTLAQNKESPADLVAAIERFDHRSWQKALELSNLLCSDQTGELRGDAVLAQHLADALDRQMQLKTPSADRIRLQVYLCRALGEFQVSNGLSNLAKVAGGEPAWTAAIVRRAAMQALAVRAESMGGDALASIDGLVPMIIVAAGTPPTANLDDDRMERLRLRGTSIYVLGLVGNPTAEHALLELLEDEQADIRFNAATGLARIGNRRAVPYLIRMLQWVPSTTDGLMELYGTPTDADLRQKQELVQSAALRAMELMIRNAPVSDWSSFREPITRISEDSCAPSRIRQEARDTLRRLDNPSPS